MNKVYIPRYGKSGVIFLGSEVSDILPFIFSVAGGMLAIPIFDAPLSVSIAIPVMTFLLNREYVVWKTDLPGGAVREFLFYWNLKPYSASLSDRNTIYSGSARAHCPNATANILKEMGVT